MKSRRDKSRRDKQEPGEVDKDTARTEQSNTT